MSFSFINLMTRHIATKEPAINKKRFHDIFPAMKINIIIWFFLFDNHIKLGFELTANLFYCFVNSLLKHILFAFRSAIIIFLLYNVQYKTSSKTRTANKIFKPHNILEITIR